MPGHPCFVVEPSGLVRGHRAESSLVVIHEYLIQNSTCASYTYVLFYLASLQSLRDTMRLRSSALSATRAQRARSACTWGRCVCARASCGAIALGGRSSGATSRLACAARAAAAPSACGQVRESTSASGECCHGAMRTLSASRADDVHGQVRGVSRAGGRSSGATSRLACAARAAAAPSA